MQIERPAAADSGEPDHIHDEGPTRIGLIVWIAIGSVIGCSLAVVISTAPEAVDGSAAMSAQWGGSGGAPDLAVDGGVAGALLILALLLLTRAFGDRSWYRALWALEGAFLGLAHGVLACSFATPSDPRVTAPTEAELVSIEGSIQADPVDRGARKPGRLPGEDLLSTFAMRSRGASFTLVTDDDAARRYDIELAALPPSRPGFAAGDRVRVRGWLTPDQLVRNPGGLDASAWRARRSVIGRVVVEDPSLLEPIESPPQWTLDRSTIVRCRAWLGRGLRTSLPSTTSPAVRDMLMTMTLGIRGENLPAVCTLFSRTGLSHFIVISGFHLSVLAAAVLIVARRLGAGSRHCGAVLLLVSIVFLVLLDSHVSVVRAGLAGIVSGIALLLDRGWSAMTVLALVTVVVLLLDPLAVSEPAFQLSFGAVAALLLMARPMARWIAFAAEFLLAPRRSRTPSVALRRCAVARIMARPFGAALAAWVIATPLTLHHFGQIAPWSVLGSVVFAPVASLIAILGMPVSLLGAVLPSLAAPLGWVISVAGAFFLRGVEWCALLPVATVQRPLQSGWWASIMIVLPFIALRRRSPGGTGRALTIAVCAAWVLLGTVPWWPPFAHVDEIISLDLGRGHCVLVRTERGCAVIDAGAPGSATAGSRIIVPALTALGVRGIDTLVVTARSMSSISAVPEILRSISVEQLLVPESMLAADAGGATELVISAARRVGVEIVSHDQDSRESIASLASVPVPPAALDWINAQSRKDWNRGARRLHLDPLKGWLAQRYGPAGWVPVPIPE